MGREPPEWDDYRYLLALSRCGTLSGAADQLGVVRTTVGRRLGSLEERLGVALFSRGRGGYEATAAGKDLIEVAESLEATMMAAEARVLGRDAVLAGPLRVSTMDFLIEGFPHLFRTFADRYPGIEVTVTATNRPVSLQRREADVALRLGNSPTPSLVGRRLCDLRFVPAASCDLVERWGTTRELAAFPWLSDDPDAEPSGMDAWLSRVVPEAKVAMRFDNYPGLRAAVRAGIGAHLLWKRDVDANPDLVELDVVSAQASMPLWVLTLADLRSNSRVRAFLDHAWETLRS